MMNVVSFSGGKDSTAMLLMMIERGMKVDRILCIDTTKEFPQMYRHIQKVQAMVPIVIETIKINFDYWFGEHVKTRGQNKGKVGYGFPDFQNRWCTALKRQIFRKTLALMPYNPEKRGGVNYIPSSIVEYHGISYDERDRTNKNSGRNIRYPLVEWGVTGTQTLEYCYAKRLDWGGLYKKFHRVSCWCCPLSRIGELRILHNEFPELWTELIEMDKKSFRKFRSDYSIQELSERFANENL